MQQLRQQLKNFVIDNFLYGQPEAFTDDDSFLKKGFIDSTGVIELISFLQDQYGITIDDNEIIPENLDSISSLCRFVKQKCQESKNYSNAS